MGRCYYKDGLHGRSRKAAVDVATPSPAPKPYPLLAAAQPGSRNEPGSRPELQSLTGKGEESTGRRSARAAPRRSRAVVRGASPHLPFFLRGSSASRVARNRPPPARRSLRRWVGHTVWSARPAAARGDAPSLVVAPAVAQYPGGGRHKPLLAARARPAPHETQLSTSHRSPAPTAHPLPSRSRLSATTNQIRGWNCNL